MIPEPYDACLGFLQASTSVKIPLYDSLPVVGIELVVPAVQLIAVMDGNFDA